MFTQKEIPKSKFSDIEIEGNHLWVTVGKHEVCIKKSDEGTIVDIFRKRRRKQDDLSDPVTSTYAFDNE
jgi:hypothetical protein